MWLNYQIKILFVFSKSWLAIALVFQILMSVQAVRALVAFALMASINTRVIAMREK